MKRREFNRLLGAVAVAPIAGNVGWERPAPRRWSLTADVAECCSCDIPCSCNFGRPEPGICHGTRLIQIRNGELDGVDLARANFVVTFHMREWTRIYLDESLTGTRLTAMERLLPLAFGGFDRAARARQRVPIRIAADADTFRFSVPESTVEMRMMPGLNGGPIRIDNLPNPAYVGYVQYESVVHVHTSADAEWSYAGTNGFRSVMTVSG